jgi:hypothetical protein
VQLLRRHAAQGNGGAAIVNGITDLLTIQAASGDWTDVQRRRTDRVGRQLRRNA